MSNAIFPQCSINSLLLWWNSTLVLTFTIINVVIVVVVLVVVLVVKYTLVFVVV